MLAAPNVMPFRKERMNDRIKNIINQCQPLRNWINHHRLNNGQNGIASARLSTHRVKRFIQFFNTHFADIHIRFLDIGACDRLASTCGVPINAIFGFLNDLKNKSIHGIEADKDALAQLAKNSEYDHIFAEAVGPSTRDEYFYITHWGGCSSILETNVELLKTYSDQWAHWWTPVQKIPCKVKQLRDILPQNASYDYGRMTLMCPIYEILSTLDDAFFKNLIAIQVLSTAIPFYKTQHTFGHIFNLMLEKNFVPFAIVPYPFFANMEIHHNLTFIQAPNTIQTVEQAMKHCLFGMMMKKPYYVSYILNKYRSLFRDEVLFKSIWAYV